MPHLFECEGLSFQYPENWTLADDSGGQDALPGTVRVAVESPQGALWCLNTLEQSPQEAVQAVLDALEEEYGDLEVAEIAPAMELGADVSQEAQFLYLDFVIRAQVHALTVGGRRLLLLFQADERQFEEAQPVFLAMAASLRSSGEA